MVVRIQVQGIEDIADLAGDLKRIPATARLRGAAVVAKNVEIGAEATRTIAKAMAGPHGEDYYKRITGEMTGPLQGEFGPEGPPKTDYVGVDGSAGAWRDLQKAETKIAARFQRDIRRMVDGLFW